MHKGEFNFIQLNRSWPWYISILLFFIKKEIIVSDDYDGYKWMMIYKRIKGKYYIIESDLLPPVPPDHLNCRCKWEYK